MLKKPVFSALLVGACALSVVLFNSRAEAVTGLCSNCHTMHNSQNNAAMAWDANLDPTDTPNQFLLRAGCVECHTANTGQVNPDSGAPAVLHVSEPGGAGGEQGGGYTNAGGDFYWVRNDDRKGHNVKDIPSLGVDANIGTTPPGWDPNATAGFAFGQVASGTSTWGSQLTCAGTYGCHGDHSKADSFPGIKYAHHTNTGGSKTQASAATTLGNSFRFLGGIKGLENSDWNWTESASNHNEYYGVNTQTNRQYNIGTTEYASRDTISFLCGECHGLFHSKIADDADGDSPWRRHPTDIVLPANTDREYQYYDTYSVQAPIARNATVPATSGSTVTEGQDIVVCLSCHRAHGSNQPDLLRWDYNGMIAGNPGAPGAAPGTGCFVCHTTKDDLL